MSDQNTKDMMNQEMKKTHKIHMDRPIIIRIISVLVCVAMLIVFPIAANSDKVKLAQHSHEMSDVIVTVEPECEILGTGYIKCLFEGCTYQETVEVPALGHQMGDVCCERCYGYFDSAINGLCETEKGIFLVKDCAVQSDYSAHYYDSEGELWYVKNGVAYDYYAGDQNFTWPTPTCDIITSYFGYRNAPTAGASTYHKGIDVGAMHGTTIVSIADGTVAEAGNNQWNGNYLYVDHGEGVRSAYLHCSQLYVEAGETVSAGDKIAAVGSTGISTGAHLHMTVYLDGVAVDPLFYVSNK